MAETEKVTRKSSPIIAVRCLPEEKREIEEAARSSGLSASAYLRQLGLEHEPKSVLDLHAVKDLSLALANMGRLGGLLKLWLSDDAKLVELGVPYRQMQRHIRRALTEIEGGQSDLRAIIQRVVRGRA
ncbi:plasmid mobilization protein [Novosphingobium terrae]|uniref:plasmid mobilization protein n=1 Tax=Novosphingobium terrae TaxID=2726189 RepID=UPI001F143877|nr:conjugal transfer protein TraJ [Novosphingobium terrae]